ncbi:aldose epimerase family protein [Thermospira aquatica]|uniref:DUF5107 domain-containing protein n=1 Tax=Thermospira aquatica TaxID=2828656 RepID=A0AAX3BB06_9SPIR|nr:hypothetical protein [Thermospira aquatica]URA09443.1 hypothetical protein KDW03_08070 [Thermospira aquatica]
MTPLVIENHILRLAALPQLGGKVISFFIKPIQKELLFQPQRSYRIPSLGDNFADYDTSGWDEMLPTIDPCQWKDTILPDHGELWCQPWEMSASLSTLTGTIRCTTLPLLFSRTIHLDNTTCTVSYTIQNLSDIPQPYLWAWHALWDSRHLTLDLPGVSHVIPVHENTFLGPRENPVPWPIANNHDLRTPSTWEGKKTAKIYLPPDLSIHQAFLRWPEVSLHVRWQSEKLPYVGVWYNQGGFKNEYNLALEPATGYYDRLDEAFARNMVSVLPPHDSHSWELHLTILL